MITVLTGAVAWPAMIIRIMAGQADERPAGQQATRSLADYARPRSLASRAGAMCRSSILRCA
jgi:hypothetical protein